jgi:hypothetical protein
VNAAAASVAIALTLLSSQALAAGKPTYSPELDKQYDLGLERFFAKDWSTAAARLYAVYRALPESELKRDSAEFHLAGALEGLGLAQGAIEHYMDIVTGRRSPDLVARSLAALDELTRRKQLDEHRLIDNVLFGNQYGDLPPDTAEFVQYYQAIGELRRGYSEWGQRKLEDLAKSDEYYGLKARHALAVARLAENNDAGAEKIFKALVDDARTPNAIRNDSRLALARLLYERKKYEDALTTYASIDSPLPSQDVVLLEKAWNQLASHDERRALGMVVGLGAPVYRRLFAPERGLIRAMALKRLCQFRAAHLAVLDFRKQYDATLKQIRERKPLADEPVLRAAVMRRDDLLPARRWRDGLEGEKRTVDRLEDRDLKGHLTNVYTMKLAQAGTQVQRSLDRALDKLAEELLATDEQMSILDYELGIELFKRIGEDAQTRAGGARVKVPRGSKNVYYKFTGEYWSDELHDYSVLADDRCVR